MKKLSILVIVFLVTGCFISRAPNFNTPSIQEAFGAKTKLYLYADQNNNSTKRGVKVLTDINRAAVPVRLFESMQTVAIVGDVKINFDPTILSQYKTGITLKVSKGNTNNDTIKNYPEIHYTTEQLDNIKGQEVSLITFQGKVKNYTVTLDTKGPAPRIIDAGELLADDTIIVEASRTVTDKQGNPIVVELPKPEKWFEQFIIENVDRNMANIIESVVKPMTITILFKPEGATDYQSLLEDGKLNETSFYDAEPKEDKYIWDGSKTGNTRKYEGKLRIDHGSLWGKYFDTLKLTVSTKDQSNNPQKPPPLYQTVTRVLFPNYPTWVSIPLTDVTNTTESTIGLYKVRYMSITLEGYYKPTGETIYYSFNGTYGIQRF